MPSSYVQNVAPIVWECMDLAPQSVLDIGAGYGKYGWLLREYLDGFEGGLRIDAVEFWPDYLTRSGGIEFYDRVFHGAWPVRVDGPYDLALMVDVLEHFEEAEGREAIRVALEVAGKVLVSTPLGFEQGPVGGNVLEAHRSEWPLEKLRELAPVHVLPAGAPDSVNVVLG